MAYERTDAITIRYAEFSETSRVFTFYTRDFGRIVALAKGAKRKYSRLTGHVDLFEHSEVVFLSRARRGRMHLLLEAGEHRTFGAIRRELPRYYAACHAAALVEAMTAEEDPSRELFEELVRLFSRLNAGPEPAAALFAFEARALALCGFFPELGRCVVCGKDRGRRAVAFSLARGGILCGECAAGEPYRIGGLSPGSLGLLERLGSGKVTRLDRIRLSPIAAGRIRSFLDQYEASVLGKQLRTAGRL